jgi:uncharacterized delta-60 repeat protein
MRRPRPLAAEPLEARFTPAVAGDLDPSFGANGITAFPFAAASTTDGAAAIALAPDGQIVTAGTSGGHEAVARLTADGKLDPSFGGTGSVVVAFAGAGPDSAAAVAVQSDGRVIAVGQALTAAGQAMTAFRLNADGTSDPSFGTGGKLTLGPTDLLGPSAPAGATSAATAVQLTSDGHVVVAGLVTFPDAQSPGQSLAEFAVVRLKSDGTFDPTFGTGGKVLIDFISAAGKAVREGAVADVRVLADGRVVLGGNVADGAAEGNPDRWRDQAVARLTSAGTLDPTFAGTGMKAFALGATSDTQDELVGGLDVQSDGRVVIASERRGFADPNALAPVVVRLTADGQFDPTFGTNGVWTGVAPAQGALPSAGDQTAQDVAVTPDGKIVVSGALFSAEPAFVRLTADGKPDVSFGNNGFQADNLNQDGTQNGLSGQAAAEAVLPDERVVFAGPAPSSAGQTALVGRVLGVTPPDAPPTISAIPDKTLTEGVGVSYTADFTVGDDNTPPENLTVTATSSNTDLVPANAVSVIGFGVNRTLTVNPQPEKTGTAVITVAVTDDGGLTATDKVTLTMVAPAVTIPSGPRIPAGEFNWLLATPNGTIAELVWAGTTDSNGATLIYRTRANSGWAEEGVAIVPILSGGVGSDSGPTERFTHAAQLLFAPDGTPNVFVAVADFGSSSSGNMRQFVDHYVRSGGKWTRADRIDVTDQAGNGNFIYHLTGTVGPNGVFDLVADQQYQPANGDRLILITNKSGNWAHEQITTTQGSVALEAGAVGDRWAPRFLSVAADSDGFVHITYTPDFYGENFGKVFSQLNYATNRGGSWQTQTVYSPPDGTGDAGLGASIAVGPGNQIAIASFFVDRVNTGSMNTAELQYHVRGADGQWSTQTVASAPDGYVAGDGAKFTGFSPELEFDGGTPVITFSDVAGQHLPQTFENSMSGQIRTATLASNGWALATIYQQSDPLHNQVWYPVRTVYNGQPVFGALKVTDHTDGSGEINGSPDLELIDVNAPSIPPIGPAPGTPGGPLGAGTVGAGAGGGPIVQAYNADGSLRFQTTVFDPSFTGGVRVATADFNGDGVPDIVVGTGPGIATEVRILDGKDQHEIFSINPFESSFTGGVYVAAGDLNGDGVPDLVITPDEGGGPRVRVFDGKNGFAGMADFYGISDPSFRGGARAAVGDVTGNGYGDLIVAAGFGGGPRVAGFDGKSVAAGNPTRVFADFYAFEQSLRNGVFVACGDVDGDGFADLIAGGGPGGGPRVTVFNGKSLLANTYDTTADFFAGDPSNRGGVRVAARELDGDKRADVIAGAGDGSGSEVTAYLGKDLSGNSPPAARDFNAFAGFTGGVYVG